MEDSRSLCAELRLLNNSMFSYFKNEMRETPDLKDLSPQQGRVIRHIQKHPERDFYQRDIEEMMCIKRSTATTMLQSMEKNGYITRENVSSDARLKRLCVTKKAESIHCQVVAQHKQMEEIARKGLSEDEIETLFFILNKIKQNFID